MQEDFDQLFQGLAQLEDSPDWETLVDSFINQTYKLSNEQAENLSPVSSQLEMKSTMKDAVGLFIKKYMKKLREQKEIIDQQNGDIVKFKQELNSLHEENEQLNEVSLTLINEIKKLKKYANESDIFISILRGEVYKQKHQNKMALNALKELYEGNEEMATKILKDAFFDSPEKSGNYQDKAFLTSPDSGGSNKRPLSLMDDKLLSGIDRELRQRATYSPEIRKRRYDIATSLEGIDEPEKRYSITEYFTPGEGHMEVNEHEEYEQDFQFETRIRENLEGAITSQLDVKELYSFDEGMNTSEKNGSAAALGGKLSNLIISRTTSENHSPARMSPGIPVNKQSVTLNQVLEERLLNENIDFTQSMPYSVSLGSGMEQIQLPVLKVERVSKWLIPEKAAILMMRSSKRKRGETIEEVSMEIEDKVDAYIQAARDEARKNTEIPIGILIKMPLSRILNMILNIWKRESVIKQ